MDNVIVGFGKTGRSVARHLERSKVDYWVADDQLSSATTLELEQLIHCVGYGPIDALAAKAGQTWIVSPGVPLSRSIFRKARDEGVRLINDLHVFRPLMKGRVVGITGSNGKSTVVAMVTHIAQALNIRAIAAGNIGLPVLDALTDEPELIVIELSSYQLELSASLDLDVAALINLMPDHLDRYESVDAYYRTKESIFDHAQVKVSFQAWRSSRGTLSSTTNRSSAWISFGDQQSSVDEILSPQSVIVTDLGDSLRFNFNNESWSIPKKGPWLSHHNAINGAAALAVCVGLGFSLAAGVRSLEMFAGLPHRCEIIPTKDNVCWVNDSKATNVSAAVSAIESFRRLGPLILIVGGRPKMEDFNPLFSVLGHTPQLKALVVYGEASSMIDWHRDELRGVLCRAELNEAIDTASQMATPGDVILFSPACSSFDQFSNFEARGDAFRQQVLGLAA